MPGVSLLASIELGAEVDRVVHSIRLRDPVILEDYALRGDPLPSAEVFARVNDRYARVQHGERYKTDVVVVRRRAGTHQRCTIDLFGSVEISSAQQSSSSNVSANSSANWPRYNHERLRRPVLRIRSVLATPATGSEQWQQALETLRDMIALVEGDAVPSVAGDDALLGFLQLRPLSLAARECAQLSNLSGRWGLIAEDTEDTKCCMLEFRAAEQLAEVLCRYKHLQQNSELQHTFTEFLKAISLLAFGPVAIVRKPVLELFASVVSSPGSALTLSTALKVLSAVLRCPPAAEVLCFSKESDIVYQAVVRETLNPSSQSRDECIQLLEEWQTIKLLGRLQAEVSKDATSTNILGILMEMNGLLRKDPGSLISFVLHHFESRAITSSLASVLSQSIEAVDSDEMVKYACMLVDAITGHFDGALLLATSPDLDHLAPFFHLGPLLRTAKRLEAISLSATLLCSQSEESISSLCRMCHRISVQDHVQEIITSLSYPGIFYALVHLSNHESSSLREMAAFVLSVALQQPSCELAKLLLDFHEMIRIPFELEGCLTPYRIASSKEGVQGLLRMVQEGPSVAVLRLLPIVGSRGAQSSDPAGFLLELLCDSSSGSNLLDLCDIYLKLSTQEGASYGARLLAIAFLELVGLVLFALKDLSLQEYSHRALARCLIDVLATFSLREVQQTSIDQQIVEASMKLLLLWCDPRDCSAWFSEKVYEQFSDTMAIRVSL